MIQVCFPLDFTKYCNFL